MRLPLARPYSRFVVAYDGMVGVASFLRVRRAFERLVQRYGIRFCSAADIGCGTGLFASYLRLCWGARVYGVDKSSEMLCAARNRCPAAGVSFLRQDIRNLCLPEPVDLVTANFDTLNHVVEAGGLANVFGRVAANLRTGGHFYFDIVTPCQPLAGRRTYRRTHCTERQWMEQRVRWEPAHRLLRIQVVQQETGGGFPVIENHTERAYAPSAVGSGLLQAGFFIRGVHDEATIRIPDRCPPRMIVVAQKRPQLNPRCGGRGATGLPPRFQPENGSSLTARIATRQSRNRIVLVLVVVLDSTPRLRGRGRRRRRGREISSQPASNLDDCSA